MEGLHLEEGTQKVVTGAEDIGGFCSKNGGVEGSVKYLQDGIDRNLGSIAWIAQDKGKGKESY